MALRPQIEPDRVRRVHWTLGDGRFACLVDPDSKQSLSKEELRQTPFCGSCLVLLMLFRMHGEWLWKGCAKPDQRPSEALKRLSGTRWAALINTDRPAGRDTWWFENDEEGKS